MAKFDTSALFQGAIDEVLKISRPSLLDAILNCDPLRDALLELKSDVEKTLAAIETETNPNKLSGLQRDLEETLIARRKAITSRAASLVASDVSQALEIGLKLVGQIIGAAARAFVARA